MRRKVVILLAVPILFLVSLLFLMSDIKNLSTHNDEFLKTPDTVDANEKGAGRRIWLDPGDQFSKDSDINAKKLVTEKKKTVEKTKENKFVADKPKERKFEKDLVKPKTKNSKVSATEVVLPQAPKQNQAPPPPVDVEPEIQPLPKEEVNTAGGFGKDFPEGQRSMNEHKKSAMEKPIDRPGAISSEELKYAELL